MKGLKVFITCLINYPLFVFAFMNKLFGTIKLEKVKRKSESKNGKKNGEGYTVMVLTLLSPFFALALLPFALVDFMEKLNKEDLKRSPEKKENQESKQKQ